MEGYGSGHRVVTVAAPGVAAQDAFDGEPAAFEGAVFFKCFQAVLGAGRRVPAP